jgi:hypothetical protein
MGPTEAVPKYPVDHRRVITLNQGARASDITALARNQSPGMMAGKLGLAAERAGVEKAWKEDDRFALMLVRSSSGWPSPPGYLAATGSSTYAPNAPRTNEPSG